MNSKTKVVCIGIGSFVFGPTVLHQAICELRMTNLELVLVDLNPAVLELMSAIARRMAREAGIELRITTNTERREALPGADFVLCSAAPQMIKRHEMDLEIIQRHMPRHVVTEFGGIAGLSYSLRQIAFIRGLAADMRQLCPDAWLLNVSNPLPRVCQAAHESGIKTAGFCQFAISGYNTVARLLGRDGASFPWTALRQEWDITFAGVNHFCWVLEFRDRRSGDDLMPQLRDALCAGATNGSPITESIARRTGYLIVPGDEHIATDFLPPVGEIEPMLPYHGDAAERQARHDALSQYAAGGGSLEAVIKYGAWERPMYFIAALAGGQPHEFPTLNLVNNGQISNLPHGVYVETPCHVGPDGVKPTVVTLPDAVLPYVQATAGVTDTLVRAALTHSRAKVAEFIELDPTVTDKAAGHLAAAEILATHADMIGEYH